MLTFERNGLRSTDKRFPGAFPIAYHVNRYRLNRGLSFVPWHASVLSSRLYTPVFVSPEHMATVRMSKITADHCKLYKSGVV